MADHSTWANIKHNKAQDGRSRRKLFTTRSCERTGAARAGGGDRDSMPRLRLAMDKALSANMPTDTIERAIQRGTGDGDDGNYEELRYEGYGPNGVAIM